MAGHLLALLALLLALGQHGVARGSIRFELAQHGVPARGGWVDRMSGGCINRMSGGWVNRMSGGW
eukprot:804636-Prymnesium_polylepis.1